ncbi:MAG: VOC family protein [Kribbellaceae bacterium]|nr:VOC family protein [Kribbellaceae bacterium]
MADQQIKTFLMFEGGAEKAMNFYLSLFDDAEVVSMSKYGAEGPGPKGSVMVAVFRLAGQQFMCSDSFQHHGFTFTPSMSLFVDCADEAELERLYNALVEGGGALMPLGEYGFSKKFGWVNDRFGVSWQLNLP